MKLFDLHCDTAYEIFDRKTDFSADGLHVTLSGIAAYDEYVQVFAHFCDHKLTDEEAWQRFLPMNDYFVATTEKTHFPCPTRAIPSIEDARLLAGDIRRMDELSKRGIKVLTFQWKDETCIGGSWNTDAPLTPFGKEVLAECLTRGIVPDVSHASELTARQILEACAEAGRPAIASHSNALALCAHRRNLSDDNFRILRESGGLVGINLAPNFLTDGGKNCNVDAICAHIFYFLEHDGGACVALGCDLDGIGRLPDGMTGIGSLLMIADALRARGVTDDVIDNIFYGNARRFAECYIF